MEKSGFDTGVCEDCAYNRRGKCTVCNRRIGYLNHCPNGYTYEEIDEIYREIKERLSHRGGANNFYLSDEEEDNYG